MSVCIALAIHAETSTNSPMPLPVTIVQGVGTSPEIEPVTEAAPVGPYNQPEWTTARRFPTTRVYLQQRPGEVGVEQCYTRRPAPQDFDEYQHINLIERFHFIMNTTASVAALRCVET